MNFVPDDIIDFQSIPQEEYVDLNAQLNDDAPPAYNINNNSNIIETSHANFNYKTNQWEYYNQSNEEVDSIWSDYFTKSQRYSTNLSRLDEDIKQIREDFGDNKSNIKTDNIFDEEIIAIYNDENVDTIELADINFIEDKIPDKIKLLKNIKKFSLQKSNLKSLENTPINLTHLILNYCNLSIVDCSIFSKSLKYLNLANNKIILITDINPNIEELILDNNELEYISDLPPIKKISIKTNKIKDCTMFRLGVEILDLNNNCIEDIEGLPDSVIDLDVARNPISIISLLPECLKRFLAYNCRISKFLCEFPDTLEKLDLYNNMLESIPPIKQFLKWIDVSENDLKYIPKPLANVEYLDISNNEKLKMLPTNAWDEYKLNSLVIDRTYTYDKSYQFANYDDITYDSDSSLSTDCSSCASEKAYNLQFKKNILNLHTNTDTQKDEIYIESQNNVMIESNNNINIPMDNTQQENDRNLQELIKQIKEKNNITEKESVTESVTNIIQEIKVKKLYKEDKNNYIKLGSTYSV